MKNNPVKKSLSTITISKQCEENILNKTIRKQEHHFLFNLSFVSVLILVISCITLTVSGVEVAKKWHAKMNFQDGTTVELGNNLNFKQLPASAPKVDQQMTYSELEATIGFPILKADATDEIYYRVGLNSEVNFNGQQESDEIGRLDLWIPNYYINPTDPNKYLTCEVTILNEGISTGYLYAIEHGKNPLDYNIVKNYHSAHLNTPVLITNYKDNNASWYKINFTYDDIYYNLMSNNMSLDEVIDIIESLSY